jgi:hypothetical protein
VISNLGTTADCSHTQATSDLGIVSVAISAGGCDVIFSAPSLATTQYAHISLSDGQLTKEFSVEINPVQTATILLSPSNINSPADGSTSTTINASALDNTSASVPDGTVITFSLTGSAGGSLSSSSCSTVSGTCKVSYKSSITDGSSTIEASSYGATASVQITLTQLPPSSVSLSSTNSSINGDGHSTTSITAKVSNKLGNPVSNIYLTFYTNMGSITQSCKTDSSGECSVSYTSSNQAGTSTVGTYVTQNSSIYGSTMITLIGVSNIAVASFYEAPYIGGNPTIVPVFAINNEYLDQNMATLQVINNGSATFTGQVSLSIPNWADTQTQQLSISPQSSQTLYFNPQLNSQALSNNQGQSVSYLLTIQDSNGHVVYQNSYTTNISSFNTMDWFSGAYTDLIASWVTPTAQPVHTLVSDAAQYAPGKSMVGYQLYGNGCGLLGTSSCDEFNSTYLQLQALWKEEQSLGLHYVNAPNDFSGEQTVYTPTQSLDTGGLNCIDGALVFASAASSMGMQPYIALVPGHAFVCVAQWSNSGTVLCVETTMVGSGASFSQAYSEGGSEFGQYQKAGQLTLINVAQVLSNGAKSLPSS